MAASRATVAASASSSNSNSKPAPLRPMTSAWALAPDLRRPPLPSTAFSASPPASMMMAPSPSPSPSPRPAFPTMLSPAVSVTSLSDPMDAATGAEVTLGDGGAGAGARGVAIAPALAISAWAVPEPPELPLPAAHSELAATLADLMHPAEEGAPAVRIAVAGADGIGRAALARTVASAVRERFAVGWALDGTSEPAILLGLQELAAELLQGSTGSPDTLVDTVHRELSRGDRRGGWLLLVENTAVDRVDSIVASLLPDRGGCIVITTEGQLPSSDPTTAWTVIDVPPLPVDDLAALLTGSDDFAAAAAAETSSAAEADAVAGVAALLAGSGPGRPSTLAAVLASKHRRHAKLTWAAYAAELHRRLNAATAATATTAADAAIALAIDAAVATGPRARELLGLVQVLHPTAIPRSLVPPAATAAFESLEIAGLLIDVTPTRFSVHPATQRALQAVAPADGLAATTAVNALNAVMNELGPASDMATVRGALVQYRHLLQWLEGPGGRGNSAEAVATLRACARLHQLGFRQPAEALAMYARVVEIKEAQYGPDHTNVATALIHLGAAYGETGNHTRQIELLERALAIRERRYGLEHPHVGAIATILASAYRALGESARPQLQFRAALDTELQGHNHRRQKSNAGSGGGGSTNGSPVPVPAPAFAEVPAEPAPADPQGSGSTAAAAVATPALPPSQPDPASSSAPPAAPTDPAPAAVAEAPDAGLVRQRELLERALAILERQHGPEHGDVGRTLTNLGVACYSLGDFNRARDVLQRALAIKAKAFGADHIQVAVTAFNLGLAFRALDDRPAALASFQRAHDIYERQHGPTHPATRQARAAITAVESNRGSCVVS